MPAILELGKWLQEDQEFRVILGYIGSQPELRKTMSQKKKKKKNKTLLHQRPLGCPFGVFFIFPCPWSPAFPTLDLFHFTRDSFQQLPLIRFNRTGLLLPLGSGAVETSG